MAGHDPGRRGLGWLNQVSPRLLLNLVYVHLRSRQEHGEKCTQRACGSGCGYLVLEEWLSAPLLEADFEADERRRQRREALMRGEIPA